MVCSGCGARLIDGTSKCPFCKELLAEQGGESADVTYQIDSPKQIDLIKNSTGSGVSSDKRKKRMRRKRRKKIKAYVILGIIAAAFIAVIVGIIALFAHIFSDNNKYTTAYYRNNSIGLYYDGTVLELTDGAVDTGTTEDGGSYIEIIQEKEFLKTSQDGKITAFIDGFDAKNNFGALNVLYKDKTENIEKISDKVFNSFVMSDDGKKILFLKNANAKGNSGELWYWEKGEDAVKVAEKVDAGRFLFSEDYKKIIYIKNYNFKTRCGEAYYAETDDLSEVKIDKEVYAIYGSSDDGKAFIYAKNYNADRETFDLYVRNAEEAVRAVMDCSIAPIPANDSEYWFVCGDKNSDRYNLYRVKPSKLSADKVITNMNEILRVSDNGKQIVYSKLFDNNVADYYIWTEGEQELKVADGVNYTKAGQMAVSEDFSTIAYIANYDENKNGGIMYICKYSEDKVSEPEKISEDVYSCYVLKNNKVVYNKNYSSKGKTAGLYIYNGSEAEINPEVNPRFVKISGNNILCIYDYDSNSGGSLYAINDKLEENKITTDVFDFDIKKNSAVCVYRNKDGKTSKFDLYETDKKLKNVTLIAKDVDGVLKY